MERSTFGGIPINTSLVEALDRTIPKFRREAPTEPQPLTPLINEAAVSELQDESIETNEPILITNSGDVDHKNETEKTSPSQSRLSVEQTTEAWDVDFGEVGEDDDPIFDDEIDDGPAVSPKYVSRFDKFENSKYGKDPAQVISIKRRKVIGGAVVATVAAASFALLSTSSSQKNIHSSNTIAARTVPASTVTAKASAHTFHAKFAEHSKTITANVPLTPAMIAANQRAKEATEPKIGKLTAGRIEEINKQDHPSTKTHHKSSETSTPADPVTPPAATPVAPVAKAPTTISTPKGHAAKAKAHVVRSNGGASPVVQQHHAKSTGDTNGGASLN